MAVYRLKEVQNIPIGLSEAWDFFSHPANLAVMTPGYLNLKFTNELFGKTIYPGQVITYSVRPLLGISIFWMTEIKHVRDREFFIDEQRAGPYSIWHHQHHFREIPGGVEMTDLVHYRIPGWVLGDLANRLFIRQQLKDIFKFRKQMVEEIFGIYTVEGGVVLG